MGARVATQQSKTSQWEDGEGSLQSVSFSRPPKFCSVWVPCTMYATEHNGCILYASDHATGLRGRRWLVRTGTWATYPHLQTGTTVSVKHIPRWTVNWPKMVDDESGQQLHQHEVMLERLCCQHMNFMLRYRRQEPVVWASRAWHKSTPFALHIDSGSVSPQHKSLRSLTCCLHPPSCPTVSSVNFSAVVNKAIRMVRQRVRPRPLLSQRRHVAFSSQNQANWKCQCRTSHRWNLSL